MFSKGQINDITRHLQPVFSFWLTSQNLRFGPVRVHLPAPSFPLRSMTVTGMHHQSSEGAGGICSHSLYTSMIIIRGEVCISFLTTLLLCKEHVSWGQIKFMFVLFPHTPLYLPILSLWGHCSHILKKDMVMLPIAAQNKTNPWIPPYASAALHSCNEAARADRYH